MKTVVIRIFIFFFLCTGCGLLSGDSEEQLEFAERLYLQIDGNRQGIWVLETESLSVVDNMITPRAPTGLAVADNGRIWHSIWVETDNRPVLHKIDVENKAVIRKVDTGNLRGLLFNEEKNQVIVYNDLGKISIFDAESYDLMHQDTIKSGYLDIPVVGASGNEMMAFTMDGIIVYDLEEYGITQTILLTDDEQRRKSMPVADIMPSSDGKFLYVTAFTWLGWDGVGSFHVIDLDLGETISEHEAGKFSKLAMDDRYVYVTGPAGRRYGIASYDLMPLNKMWRYDKQADKMEVFIDGHEELNFEGPTFLTYYINSSLKTRHLFINMLKGKVKDKNVTKSIIKLDPETKEIMAGYQNSPGTIWNMSLLP